MPTLLYVRGSPGSGKHTTCRILERDLGWPRLWVHHLDAVYRAIGEHKVPELTDDLMTTVAKHLMKRGRDFIFVRPSRQTRCLSMANSAACFGGYAFVPVRLTATYETLVTRVTRRQCGNESPFRLNTKAALDEYLGSRPEAEYPGEHVIATDDLTPEQVADRIKELLP